MSIISSILGNVADMEGRLPEDEDPVLLTSEERASAHGALTTRGGRVIRVSLPRGTELNDGDVLAVADGVAVVVRAAPETLFAVRPQTALMWGVAGFHLGNLHRPVRFRDDAMLTPAERKVAEVLSDAGIAFETVETAFVGTRYGSYAGHAHGHDHGHGHDPDHAHDHAHGHRLDENA